MQVGAAEIDAHGIGELEVRLQLQALGSRFAEVGEIRESARQAPSDRDVLSFEESGFEGEVPSEERVLENRQALEAFLAVLAEMSPRRRMVFTMHRFMGLSYGAIATRLGISVGVVEKHMMKALLQFHCRLGPP